MAFRNPCCSPVDCINDKFVWNSNQDTKHRPFEAKPNLLCHPDKQRRTCMISPRSVPNTDRAFSGNELYTYEFNRRAKRTILMVLLSSQHASSPSSNRDLQSAAKHSSRPKMLLSFLA